MPGPEFFQTRMGQKYYEADVPRIAEALEHIGKQLMIANELKKKELERERQEQKTEAPMSMQETLRERAVRQLAEVHEFYQTRSNNEIAPPCPDCKEENVMARTQYEALDGIMISHQCCSCGYELLEPGPRKEEG